MADTGDGAIGRSSMPDGNEAPRVALRVISDAIMTTPMRAKKAESNMSRIALLGTWKLVSYEVICNSGEKSTPYGEHPMGYLSYSADGRMQVIGTASGRSVPRNSTPTDGEHLVLHKTMFAYGGTYSVEAGKVTHHVDISWNEVWNGTDQVRDFVVDGNTLTITSRLIDAATAKEALYVVIWEKIIPLR